MSDTMIADNPRAVAGGNNPPPSPYEAVAKTIDDLYAECGLWLDGAVVDSQSLADGIGNLNLSGANLRGAYLRGANLSGANLSGANLSGAKEVPDFTMPDGLKFSEYLRDVVPALLTAGGKTIKQIIEAGAWECHSWENCPMAVAFNVHRVEDVPPLYRARAQEFVKFYDSKMIPAPIAEGESAASEG